jgi:hypothetical protein
VAGEALRRVALRVARARAVRRFRRTGTVDCALRAMGEDVQTITSAWLYGEATVEVGQLTFRRHDMDEVVGPLPVLRLDESQMRLSPLRDNHVVVRLVTGAGELEWDLLAHVLDEAVAGLALP